MVFRLNNTSKTFGGRAPTGLSTGNNTPILDTLMLLHNCTCITSTSIAECKLCCSNATGFLDAAMGSQEQQQQSFYGPLSDYPGEPVPEETFTHPASWSSSNLYQLLPPTTIRSILPVQITCLAIISHHLSGNETKLWVNNTNNTMSVHVCVNYSENMFYGQ